MPALTRGPDRCTLLIHPADAGLAGVADGDRVRVSTSEGALVVPARLSEEMMPGVVSLPHGWSGNRNSNRLNPGDVVDVPSGTVAINGVPCRVQPEAVTLAP